MSFDNKVVLVTGGSSGLGAAIAIKFAAEGAKVAIVGRNQNKLNNVSEICTKNGGVPLVIVAELTNDDEAKTIVSRTISHFGKLDVLVNNAGVGGWSSILAPDALQLLDKYVAINLRAAVYLTNLAAPHLIETKGSIINISSITSTCLYVKENFAYASAKAALDHFTRCVALELAPKGVRVNTVRPGVVKTDVFQTAGFSEEAEEIFLDLAKKAAPLGKLPEPEEIADLVVYLASDKAKSITGASYAIDNGSLLIGSMDRS